MFFVPKFFLFYYTIFFVKKVIKIIQLRYIQLYSVSF